jgi:hypothetical protein
MPASTARNATAPRSLASTSASIAASSASLAKCAFCVSGTRAACELTKPSSRRKQVTLQSLSTRARASWSTSQPSKASTAERATPWFVPHTERSRERARSCRLAARCALRASARHATRRLESASITPVWLGPKPLGGERHTLRASPVGRLGKLQRARLLGYGGSESRGSFAALSGC